jgi:CubicO group peptidase (beta-lactamase class C family)
MLLVWFLLVLPSALGRSSSESLNRYVIEAMERNHIPSVAALRVTDRGATTETAFWGYANIENKEAPTADTAYLLASVSKLFVATAIMQLEERGLLSLGDDVNTLLPDGFPSIRNPSYPNVPITVRQLLTHTGSIRDDWSVIDESYVYDAVDPEISLQAFTKTYFTPSMSKSYRSKHKPGTDYAYANMGTHSPLATRPLALNHSHPARWIGYSLLGVIVEEIGKSSFEQFTQTNIFKPLGMDPASWLIEGLLDSGASIAMPYRWQKRDRKFVEYGHYTFSGAPDGGLRTSVDGLGAFVKMVLNDGVSTSGRRILKASTLKKMLRQATPVEDWQGLGWYESEVDGGGVWGHGGAEQGVSTMLMVDRRRGRAVVVLTNGDDAFEGDDDYEMLDMFWDW